MSMKRLSQVSSRFALIMIISAIHVAAVVLIMVGCASRSVLPDQESVKVSREAPSDKACRELGPITGRTMTAQGTNEQALEDLKREAANKGANYIVVKQYSNNGTAVTGIAYECP